MTRAITPILAATLTATASAVPTIDWYSIDSGGAVSTGGTLELRGVIGQPDASPLLSGGTTTLTGGFLSPFSGAVNPMGCNPADIVEPYGFLDLADITSFITFFSNNDPLADLDGSGLLDLADINFFVANFMAGCP